MPDGTFLSRGSEREWDTVRQQLQADVRKSVEAVLNDSCVDHLKTPEDIGERITSELNSKNASTGPHWKFNIADGKLTLPVTLKAGNVALEVSVPADKVISALVAAIGASRLLPERITMSERPRIFISHDTRDADLAKGFSVLINKLTGGLVACFRSTDVTGDESAKAGPLYGNIATALDGALAVVCLLTMRSYERPWVLYEAGYSLGRRIPVYAIEIGTIDYEVPEGGPFSHLIRSRSTNEVTGCLKAIFNQIPNCTPDVKNIETHAIEFLESATTIDRALSPHWLALGVHHVSLAVRDKETAESFYSRLLGLAPSIQRPTFEFRLPDGSRERLDGVWFVLPSGQQLHLVVYPKGTFRTDISKQFRDNHFALQVRNIETFTEHLDSLGIPWEPMSGNKAGFPQIYIVDPDHHIVEVNATPTRLHSCARLDAP